LARDLYQRPKVRVVNFFAGPSSGKSTFACAVFAQLKVFGIRAELVTEFAKDATYEKREAALSNQLYVTAKQFHRMDRLRGQVDIIVTDSPILLGLIYKPDWYFTGFEELVWSLHASFDNLNYFINRDESRFHQYGRKQNLDESIRIDSKIRKTLASRTEKYKSLDFGLNYDRFWATVVDVANEIASIA
jgi:hypothetical protein